MTEERQVFCSGCYRVVRESEIHVIPFFNEDLFDYVTTYRCNDCWLAGLDDTEKRLQTTEELAEILRAAFFFERHTIFIAEFRRGDSLESVRPILLQLIGLLRSGGIRLAIGRTRPFSIDEAEG
jgi:hypothetical protein